MASTPQTASGSSNGVPEFAAFIVDDAAAAAMARNELPAHLLDISAEFKHLLSNQAKIKQAVTIKHQQRIPIPDWMMAMATIDFTTLEGSMRMQEVMDLFAEDPLDAGSTDDKDEKDKTDKKSKKDK
jgi:hypothetical protein